MEFCTRKLNTDFRTPQQSLSIQRTQCALTKILHLTFCIIFPIHFVNCSCRLNRRSSPIYIYIETHHMQNHSTNKYSTNSTSFNLENEIMRFEALSMQNIKYESKMKTIYANGIIIICFWINDPHTHTQHMRICISYMLMGLSWCGIPFTFSTK